MHVFTKKKHVTDKNFTLHKAQLNVQMELNWCRCTKLRGSSMKLNNFILCQVP